MRRALTAALIAALAASPAYAGTTPPPVPDDVEAAERELAGELDWSQPPPDASDPPSVGSGAAAATPDGPATDATPEAGLDGADLTATSSAEPTIVADPGTPAPAPSAAAVAAAPTAESPVAAATPTAEPIAAALTVTATPSTQPAAAVTAGAETPIPTADRAATSTPQPTATPPMPPKSDPAPVRQPMTRPGVPAAAATPRSATRRAREHPASAPSPRLRAFEIAARW